METKPRIVLQERHSTAANTTFISSQFNDLSARANRQDELDDSYVSVVPKQMSGVTVNKNRLIINREKVHQIPEVHESLQRSSGESGGSQATAKFECNPSARSPNDQ